MQSQVKKETQVKKQSFFRLTLFWKILLWFWFTLFFLFVGLWTITRDPVNTISDRDKSVWTMELNRASRGIQLLPGTGSPLQKHDLWLKPKQHTLKLEPSLESAFRKPNLIREVHKFHKPIFVDPTGKILTPKVPQEFRDFVVGTRLNRSISFFSASKMIFIGPESVLGKPGTVVYLIRPSKPPSAANILFYKKWSDITILFIASGLLCLWFSWTFTKPLQKLCEAAEHLAGGNYDQVEELSRTKSNDEVGDLAREMGSLSKQIQEAMRAHQDLLKNMSHELKAPLNRLQLGADLARTKSGGEKDKAFLRIDKEVFRLNEMLAKLIFWSKLERDISPLHRETLSVAALLDPIIKDAQFEGSKDNKTVALQLDSNSKFATEFGFKLDFGFEVNLDIKLVQSAVENLIRNALKYTPANTEVRVSLKKEGPLLYISVGDHGPGVPPEQLEQIFSPFYRVPEAGAQTGTGLGLAIAFEVAQMHEGSIYAENKNGGLVVTLQLHL